MFDTLKQLGGSSESDRGVKSNLYCLTKISIRSSVNFPADSVCLWSPVPF